VIHRIAIVPPEARVRAALQKRYPRAQLRDLSFLLLELRSLLRDLLVCDSLQQFTNADQKQRSTNAAPEDDDEDA
jgi:hypothetical protein